MASKWMDDTAYRAFYRSPHVHRYLATFCKLPALLRHPYISIAKPVYMQILLFQPFRWTPVLQRTIFTHRSVESRTVAPDGPSIPHFRRMPLRAHHRSYLSIIVAVDVKRLRANGQPTNNI